MLGWLCASDERVVNLYMLTYAGNLSLTAVADLPSQHRVKGDICDQDLVSDLLERLDVRAIVHLAAESMGQQTSFVRM